ncbi:MAG: VWA domain-containing protein [Deltaproteobacteria bacterium]
MAYTHFHRCAAGWSLTLLALFACKGGDHAKPLGDLTGRGGSSGVLLGQGGTAGSGGLTQTADAGADASTLNVYANCENLVCGGAGKCVVKGQVAECVCDSGYFLDNQGTCVVDETCINLRLLESGCRQRLDAEPALGIFFGLETCAGTTVRPDVLGNLNTAFKVLEDGNALGDESYVALFRRSVESHVAIALDLSGSVQQDQPTLIAVIAQLKQMVRGLQPAPGAPPVSVALLVFGRTVQVQHAFTRDLSEIVTTLDAIQANPAAAVQDPGGTNLFGAVNLGMDLLDGAAKARRDETEGAVVTTGTLVTVTDGRDSSGVLLDKLDERFNLISVGISGEINDTELTQIGPQGSFLAPTQADWSAAFDRVVQRVLEYPQRSYLLGYCSPAVAGTHKVTVTLANMPAKAAATCSINAAEFGTGALCNGAFIAGFCGDTCRSFLACGACSTNDGGTSSQADTASWDFTK